VASIATVIGQQVKADLQNAEYTPPRDQPRLPALPPWRCWLCAHGSVIGPRRLTLGTPEVPLHRARSSRKGRPRSSVGRLHCVPSETSSDDALAFLGVARAGPVSEAYIGAPSLRRATRQAFIPFAGFYRPRAERFSRAKRNRRVPFLIASAAWDWSLSSSECPPAFSFIRKPPGPLPSDQEAKKDSKYAKTTYSGESFAASQFKNVS
jgi:hypothetical protein